MRLFQSVRRRLAGVADGELRVEELPALLGTDRPVILEIGCNDGGHTLQFLAAFPGGRIHCFEPDARAQRRFAEQVHSDRATLVPVAIGAHDGTTTFYASQGAPSDEWSARLPEGWDLSGSIRPPKTHLTLNPWCTFDAAAEVPVRRLDTWAGEHGVEHVDLIWADVQGAEGDLIRGGLATLARTRFLYTEYSNDEMYEGQITLRDLLAALPQFKVVRRFTGDVLLENRAYRPPA